MRGSPPARTRMDEAAAAAGSPTAAPRRDGEEEVTLGTEEARRPPRQMHRHVGVSGQKSAGNRRASEHKYLEHHQRSKHEAVAVEPGAGETGPAEPEADAEPKETETEAETQGAGSAVERKKTRRRTLEHLLPPLRRARRDTSSVSSASSGRRRSRPSAAASPSSSISPTASSSPSGSSVSAASAPAVDRVNGTSEGRRFELGNSVARGLLSTASVHIEDFLRRWMATEVVRSARVWDVCIPGSHDSASYECSHRARGVAQKGLMEFIRSFVRTQDKSVYDQLCAGVRFLDLRVCIDPLDRTQIPYCAHGGYRCANLIEVLVDVRQFLTEYPTEVVFLSCKPDAGFKTKPHLMTLAVADFWVSVILWQFLGNKLRNQTTIAELVERGQNVVYFFSEVERYLPDPLPSIQRGTGTTPPGTTAPETTPPETTPPDSGLELDGDHGTKKNPHGPRRSSPANRVLHRLTTQCSYKLDRLDSVLGAEVISRKLVSEPVDITEPERRPRKKSFVMKARSTLAV
ncbi:hypothetical protein GNI_110230 [Gregarina niphandrodes]|uniref:Phosphatidylinositol-specific phospholipase C X domain-containing protein n=1 Tax=Gregarina niphandrodes TaxID=110365 RepID=A0A023B3M0_GRENI|nr:hypothetical protein GNI_110230 [Gregarina niphandrodes]EZG55652.1 hypothetical protein GNI_110230 [Gregarina niphandrodes]|eukprot:XP_011131471.1 hypothetical protein GNI_110230 [Gregarina niphandrodes]